MYCKVYPSVKQRLIQFLHKQALASDLIQGHIQTLIAGCLHRHHFQLYLRMAAPDMLHYLFRLDNCQPALSASYYDLSTHLYLYPLFLNLLTPAGSFLPPFWLWHDPGRWL